MDVESRLRGAELPDVSVDTEAALSRTANRGRTARRRRVGLICTCAVLVAGGIAAAIVSIADGDSRTDLATGQSEEADTTSGTWRPLAPSPLTARDQGIAVWTGSAVVIAGGSDTTPCPADADCLVALSPLADGASYDPETDRWRLIADAPAPFVGGLATWTGTEVLVLAQQQFTSAPDLLFAYDPTTDRWDTRAAPPVDGFRSMAWTGDTWVGATATGPSDGSMWRYRPDTDTWEPITPDPLGPLSDRAVVWTGTELVVIGSRYGQPGLPVNGLWESAVLDVEGTWRRLPDSDIANNGGTWSPIDGLVANPGTGPSGGYDTGGVLDPTTGTWAPVPPDAPANGGATGYQGAAGRWIVADIRLLDPVAAEWRAVADRPDEVDPAVAVWTGRETISWGGTNERTSGTPELVASGHAYRPPSHRAGGAEVASGDLVVRGQMVSAGGPAGTGTDPAPGTVQALDDTATVVATAETDSDGRFDLTLPSGTYRVVGRSERYQNGNEDCVAENDVVVDDRDVDVVTVTCWRR